MRAIVQRLIPAALSLLPFAAGATYRLQYGQLASGAVLTDVRGDQQLRPDRRLREPGRVNSFSFSYQGGVFTLLPAPPVRSRPLPRTA